VNISLLIDDDKFFRRLCPLCRREFKVLLEDEQLEDLAKKGIESFMLENNTQNTEIEEEKTESEYFCPYCGQMSYESDWWTDEQRAFIRVHVENIASKIINDILVNPMKRELESLSSGPISMKVKSPELSIKDPWISPETNDMEIFDLPCCKRKIKIREDWISNIHCYFCNFLHERNDN